MTAIDHAEPSLLRYREFLPPFLDEHLAAVSLGEGWTKLIRLSREDPDVLLKLDHLMPTMSFKDRGAVVLVAVARAAGAERIIQDSSGNAGHAIAAYAARAGIACAIYVPEKTSPKKLQLIRELGADVHVIHGSREDTADAAWAAASAGAGFYASHVYNPLFLEGTKTFVYEIFEQLGGRLPACLVLPVGNGTLLLGAARGIAELAAAGHLERRPRLVAVQAERCAPIAAAFSIGKTDVTPIANEGTAAEGIAIAAPRRGAEILAAIRELDGYVLCASEESIRSEHQRLAKLGIHMELTSAATFAAFAAQREEFTATTVLPVCGAGVKSL